MSLALGEMELREQLMRANEQFRRLAAEHKMYADQLEKLTSRAYLTEDEKLQEEEAHAEGSDVLDGPEIPARARGPALSGWLRDGRKTRLAPALPRLTHYR